MLCIVFVAIDAKTQTLIGLVTPAGYIMACTCALFTPIPDPSPVSGHSFPVYSSCLSRILDQTGTTHGIVQLVIRGPEFFPDPTCHKTPVQRDRVTGFYMGGAPAFGTCCESGVPPTPIASVGYSRTYTKNADGGSLVISDAVFVSFWISSTLTSWLTGQRSIVITGIVVHQIFYFPKNSPTSCRYSRMGKCCGHFSSHFPHCTQQEANPGTPPENEPLSAQRYTPVAFSRAS